MKHWKLFCLASFLLALMSCGSKAKDDKSSESETQNQIVLTPEKTQIKGDLGDYYEVVDKSYTVTHEFGDMVSIEIKRTSKDFELDMTGIEPYGMSGSSVAGNAGFGIEFLDENDNVIDKVSPTASGLGAMYSSDDMTEALKLKSGETCTVRWSRHFDKDHKPVKFRLTSAFERNEKPQKEKSTSSSSYESEFQNAYNQAQREYENAYKKAEKEYNDAYNKAQKEYEDAYNKAAKELGL